MLSDPYAFAWFYVADAHFVEMTTQRNEMSLRSVARTQNVPITS